MSKPKTRLEKLSPSDASAEVRRLNTVRLERPLTADEMDHLKRVQRWVNPPRVVTGQKGTG